MAHTKKFYVTTPIYYATAAPHLGTLYSTVLADVAARWHKVCGEDVYFLTGTDEFGQKVAQAAQEAGKEPQAFVDSFIGAYKDLWKQYEIDYSQFMRTTNTFHIAAVQKWLKALMQKGDVYKGAYEGWYCLPCETYITEKDFVAGTQNPACLSCERPTKWVSEPAYFFRLSAYQDKLLSFYEAHPDFIIPRERFAEVISFVKAGLQDISISRSTLTWGVPFPDDDAHVTYVWADALNNYITAVGYGQDDKQEVFKKWWPADMQVMGKDILRFHAVYWPAFLMAADLSLPHHLLVHGWIKVGDYKMSKSRGNAIDPYSLLNAYGADAVRYYLLRQLAITQDGHFSIEDLEQKITSDLANDLGNLLNRMIVLAEKQGLCTLRPGINGAEEQELYDKAKLMLEEVQKEMERGYFHLALAAAWKFVAAVNSYFHSREPWKLAKSDLSAFSTVLSATAHALHTVAYVVWPVMPHKMEQLLKSLGCTLALTGDTLSQLKNEPWNKVFTVQKIDTLFQKPEPKEAEPVVAAVQPAPITPEIGIEEFVKVELRVGTIAACTIVANSEKLLRLEVDFGDCGTRTIFSGVRQSYAPEQLLGKQAVFVFNLKPRKMMGELSCGMLLMAEDAQGRLAFVAPERAVPNGKLLK